MNCNILFCAVTSRAGSPACADRATGDSIRRPPSVQSVSGTVSMPETRGVDLFVLTLLVASEAIGEMDSHAAHIAEGPHIEPLPLVAYLCQWHTAVEEVVATDRKRGTAPVEGPLHGSIGRSERFDVEGPLNGPRLEESVPLEVDGGFATPVEGVQ